MARRKTSTDGLVTTGNHVDKDTMRMVKQETAKRNGLKKYASGISVTPPSYYNPLYTPTSLQLPRDRKQINVWSFAPGTPILMADGTYKEIESIVAGDLVISANNIVRPVTHKYVNEVSKNMVTITAGDNTLSVTHDHICYVVENENIEKASSCEASDFRNYVTEKYASEIIQGDWMFRAIPTGTSDLEDEKLAYKFANCAMPIDANKGNLTLANKRRVKLQNGILFYQVKNIDVQPYIGDVHDITVDEDFNVIASIFAVRQCRHFYNTEAIPAAVIDLYASLPITGFTVECLNPHIRKFMEDMIQRLKLREILQGIALEYFMLGDVFILSELDEDHKTWKRLVIINPDQVEVRRNVLADTPVIEMIPDEDIKRIVYDQQPPELYRYFTTFLPDVIRAVKNGKNIPVDPAHITHLKHMPTPYGVYGTPLLKRVFKTLMYKEMLRRAQFVIAERYVTPLKIFKLGTLDEPPAQEEIDAMQAQLDSVLNDPSLVLVTTARLQADWQGISGKTLNLAGEYDFTEREMISGLGVSRAFLDGLGPTYANASIGGNAFLQKLENFRQSLKDWVEEKIFKPICELNDFYDTDPDTDEEYLIKVEFKWDALRLQDEASRQQALLQLRQINLISAKTLLESNHINPETEAVNIAEERDTLFDANRIAARQIAMTQGLQLRLQNQYGLQQMKNQMDLQNGMTAPGALPGAGGLPGVADSTGGGVNVAQTGIPPMGGDLLSGFSSSFAPLDAASQRPPVVASVLLRDILKQINAVLEEEDA